MHTFSVRSAAARTALAAAAATASLVALVPAATATPTTPVLPGRTLTAGAPAPELGYLDIGINEVVRKAEHRLAVQERRRAKRIAARRAAAAARSRADRIMELAAREAGDPYVWGASGPSAFDCSGYTMYVFGQLGISLPHNAAAQAAMARPVSDPEVGDLVFFGSGHVYHVAIYAGDGMIWHAPRTGDVVRKAPIWTSDVFYGRVG